MPRHPAPPSVPSALVVWVGILAAASPAFADEAADDEPSTEHYTLHAELGPELDTNAHRSETIHVAGFANDAPVVSAVGRAVVSGSISDIFRADQQVALSATVAGKVFSNASSENVAVVDSTAQWLKPLGPRWALGFSGGYYEAFQRDIAPDATAADLSARRDFRSLTPTLRLTRSFGDSVVAGLGGGYRVFVYKPDRSFDFQAPTGVLEARWARETAEGTADWEVTLRGGYEHRLFGGRQLRSTNATCTTPPNCPPTTGPAERVDEFVTSALDVVRTGRVLVGGGYGMSLNLSNSYGETVLRHFLTARFAASLPFDLYLAARVEIVYARYADKVYVAEDPIPGRPYATIEDENRDNARVELSRSLSDRLQLFARYTFYANELARHSDVSYRRQTALLSLAFNLEK